MIGALVALAGAGILIAYVINRPLNEAAAGVNEFGGSVAGTIFPEPAEQEERDSKGAIGNTLDFLLGDGAAAGFRESWENFWGGGNDGRAAGSSQTLPPGLPPAGTESVETDRNAYGSLAGRARAGRGRRD